MAKKDNFFKMELVYSIEKRQWIKTLLKRYYSSLANKIIGPILVIAGALILSLNQTVGLILGAAGLVYIIAPYITVFRNYKKIEDSKVIISLLDDKLVFNYGNNIKQKIPLYSIAAVEEDDFIIRVKPFSGDRNFIKEEIIPKENIEKGNSESFVKTLRDKIENVVRQAPDVKEGKLLLKYSVDKEDILKFIKAEYYSVKRYLFYGVIFMIIGGMFIKAFSGWNKIWGGLFLLFGIAYLIYPYLMYALKIRKFEQSEIEFFKLADDKTTIHGSDFKITADNNKIVLIDENPLFSKIILVQSNNMILYLPKNKITAGSYDEFVKLYKKENKKKGRL